jgi:predicted membrane-bound spermidine synthase
VTLAVLSLAFVLSGAAALVYQVTWQRVLALHSGVGAYSVAIIVAAFLAGLGLGSLAGGVLSKGLTPARALLLFAAVEAGVGLFGAASAWLYYDVLYARGAALYARLWQAGVLHFLALLVPTALMGMSLPLLVRGTVRDVAGAGRTIGLLYGLNLAGASAGALAAPWILVRHLGLRGALLAAALANIAVALAGLWAGRRQASETAGQATVDGTAPEAASVARPEGHLPLGWAALLYALSGGVALSLEVVWFRIVEVGVKATAFAFGTVLALYLGGLTVGCLLAAAAVHRVVRPLRGFLLCQCGVVVYAAAALALLAQAPADAPGLSWFFDFWGRSRGPVLGEEGDLATLARLYLALPLFLFGPATVLMGFSFPLLQRAVQDDPALSGTRVGMLQAANIAGCVAGTLLVGLVALTQLGAAASVRLLVLSALVFCVAGARAAGRAAPFAAAAVVVLAAAAVVPRGDALWKRLHGTSATSALVDEDASGVAAIVPDPTGPWKVFVSGRHHSWLPFGGSHTRLGAAPALVHPAPVDVAIIGLGSGNTAWAAACRPETRALTVFEISGPQPRLLRRVAAQADLPQLGALLADPRLRLVEADGRAALTHDATRYDLIEADALWPEAAYSGHLYSVEFFRRCAERLKPGGVLCTWAPTPRIYASLSRVFPHVVGTPSRDILIGSLDPIAGGPAEWEARLRTPAVSAYLGPQATDEVGRLLAKMVPLNRRGWRFPGIEVNEDLYPRDEFLAR